MIPHGLRSFQAKLIWAHNHMDALQREIRRFGDSEPCVVVHDFNRKSTKHTWRVKGNVKLPPPEISLRLGDTLYNYRGVLDHLARDIVIASKAAPTGKTAFPLCAEPGDWNSDRVIDQLKGMDPTIQARIEQLQPYNGGYANSTQRILGLMNGLGNVEKHRHFNLIAASVDGAKFYNGGGIPTDSFIHNGPIENGTVLASAHGPVDVEFAKVFGVAFGKGGKAAGKLLHELIFRIDLAVQEVIEELAWFALK
jgi:hypothetical protein